MSSPTQPVEPFDAPLDDLDPEPSAPDSNAFSAPPTTRSRFPLSLPLTFPLRLPLRRRSSYYDPYITAPDSNVLSAPRTTQTKGEKWRREQRGVNDSRLPAWRSANPSTHGPPNAPIDPSADLGSKPSAPREKQKRNHSRLLSFRDSVPNMPPTGLGSSMTSGSATGAPTTSFESRGVREGKEQQGQEGRGKGLDVNFSEDFRFTAPSRLLPLHDSVPNMPPTGLVPSMTSGSATGAPVTSIESRGMRGGKERQGQEGRRKGLDINFFGFTAPSSVNTHFTSPLHVPRRAQANFVSFPHSDPQPHPELSSIAPTAQKKLRESITVYGEGPFLDLVEVTVRELLLAGADCEKKHNQVKSSVRSIPTAGKWFLGKSEYLDWKSGASSPALCLRGIPGSGKTIISSAVVDDLRRNKRPADAVIFLYCQSASGTKYNAESSFRDILGQLLLQFSQPGVLAFDRLATLHGSRFGSEHLALTHFSRDYEKVFLIIDGLDECSSPLSVANRIPRHWQILFTCLRKNPISHLRKALPKYNHFLISPMDITPDIRRFIQLAIRRSKATNPKLAREIEDRLTLTAEGSFFWPICHMRQLRRLQTELQIREYLDRMPQGMDDLYLRSWELDRTTHSQEKVQSILHLVLCAARPMTVPELIELATAEQRIYMDVTDIIKHYSYLLIRISADKQNQPDFVLPAHGSIKVMMLERPPEATRGPGKYGLGSSIDVHDRIARFCLTYLTPGFKDNPRPVLERVSEPFMKYAVTECLEHIRSSGTDELAADFRDFFAPGSETFKVWCRLYKKQLGKFSTHGIGKHIERLDCAHLAVWFDLPMMLRQFSASELAATDYRGLNTLHVAVGISSSRPVIDYLLEKVDINSLSKYGDTALHIAVSESKHAATLIDNYRLWEAGANIHARDKAGRTALHLLIPNPERALICMVTLLRKGADPNAQDASSRTPLHLAAAAHEYVLKRRFMDPECRRATAEDYEKIISVLLEYGGDIESKDEADNTPLHVAAENVNPPLVKLLLERGASITARNKHNKMPIHLAIGHLVPDPSLIQFPIQEIRDKELTICALLDHGADVNTMIQNNQTLLHLAAHSRCELNIFNVLIRKGTAATTTDDGGVSPLHLAVKIAPILNLNEPEGYWCISWSGCRQIITHLIENGCDSRPLRGTVNKVCQFLENHYPDIVTKLDNSGQGYELEPGHPSTIWLKDVMSLLCFNGAHVSLETAQGYNVLHFAVESWASWILKHHQILVERQCSDDMSLMATYLAWLHIGKMIPCSS